MIDIHSHIIHGVDDGPSTIIQSLNMVEEAERLGINTIVASPHYQEKVFELERVEENYQELIYRARDYEVSINMGYEVFIDPNQAFMRNQDKLNKSKSVIILLEFPYNARPQKCIEMIGKYRMQKFVPIISHIERNRTFLNKFEYLVTFIKSGCYIQIDAASIVGVYGPRIKEFTKRLFQMNLADMVASNAHCASDYTQWYLQAYNNVSRWVGKERANALFHYNAKSILESRSVEDIAVTNIMG